VIEGDAKASNELGGRALASAHCGMQPGVDRLGELVRRADGIVLLRLAFHSIVRDENERYIVAVGHRSIRVFDHETGKEYTVNATGDALNYLDTQGQRAWSCFALATFSD
ncbi:hypothetical protein, partial [Chromobacterium amazonense]|uniref:phage nozzle protein n=1 Tax=Chromobacterium amazonense TaxID=1382803 RepID=UPI0031F6646F